MELFRITISEYRLDAEPLHSLVMQRIEPRCIGLLATQPNDGTNTVPALYCLHRKGAQPHQLSKFCSFVGLTRCLETSAHRSPLGVIH